VIGGCSETHVAAGVTVVAKNLEQSAILDVRGGFPFVPATPREQLSATQALFAKTFELTAWVTRRERSESESCILADYL
jgi:hypothetical protein